MSTTDGDASSRLDAALTDVFASAPTAPDEAPTVADDDWNVDGPDDEETFELPEIVPATIHPVAPVTAPASASVAAQVTAPPIAPPPEPQSRAKVAAPTPAPATAWGDHMTGVPAGAQGAQLRAPGRRPRVRRVTRVLRHIDPWSTFKVALLFSVVAYLVSLTAGVLLWRVADSTGTLDNVERWFTQFGWETFELKGGEIFHNAWIIGLFGAVGMTGGLVLVATLFNLVSDIVGGVRMTVLEEEVVERTVSSTRRYVVRRAPSGAVEAGDWDVDDDSGDGPGESSPPVRSTSVAAADWSVDDDDDDQGSRDGAGSRGDATVS